MAKHLRPYRLNHIRTRAAFAVFERQKMIYAAMRISIFRDAEIALEAVSVHSRAAPNVADDETCEVLAIRAFNAFNTDSATVAFNSTRKRNLTRKTAPLTRNLAPAFTARRVAFINFYDVARADFFFAIPRAFRRRFSRGAFGRKEWQSCD